MKRLTLLVLFTMLFVAVGTAQWQFVGLFPPAGVVPGDTLEGQDCHGIAVDRFDNVWILNYRAVARDTIQIGDVLVKKLPPNATVDSTTRTETVAVRAIHVYNKNGTPKVFSASPYYGSPLTILNMPAGKKDTIGGWRYWSATLGQLVWNKSTSGNTGRGMRLGWDGYIYASVYSQVYKIDPVTGNCVLKITPDSVNSTVSVAVDEAGEIFYHGVASTFPLKAYDNTGTYLLDVAPSGFNPGASRTLLCSKDGNDVYFADYTSKRVLVYHSDFGTLGTYSVTDTTLYGMQAESMCWNPKTGRLWASGGSFNGKLPNGLPGHVTGWSPNVWYDYDLTTKTAKDSIVWVFGNPAAKSSEEPRAIAFSTGGDTAYVGQMGTNNPKIPAVRMYRKVPTAVERTDNLIPSGYALEQNFPNPFNPTTEIRFSVGKTSPVALVLYDMLGREIAVLMYENLAPGSYKYTLNGSSLASGTYIYELRAGDVRMAKKMTLLK